MSVSVVVMAKVVADVVAGGGGLVFLTGLALRGRARDWATGWGAKAAGIAGLLLLLGSLFGVVDSGWIPAATLMLVFGTALASGVAIDRKKPPRTGA